MTRTKKTQPDAGSSNEIAGSWGSAENETLSERTARLQKEFDLTKLHLQQLATEMQIARNAEYEAKVEAVVEKIKSTGVDPRDVAYFCDHGKGPSDGWFAFKVSDSKPKTAAAKKTPAAPPKYFNPANPNEQWSGRGMEPAWATPYQLSAKPRAYKEKIHIK